MLGEYCGGQAVTRKLLTFFEFVSVAVSGEGLHTQLISK